MSPKTAHFAVLFTGELLQHVLCAEVAQLCVIFLLSVPISLSILFKLTQDIQQGKTLEDENPSVLRDWIADVWKTGHVLYRC